MAKFYKVGGCVRDALLGVESTDIDYTVTAESFADMRAAILDRGGEIFLETPKFFTIRAKVPQLGACDYVLARKEGKYSDGRRPDSVEMGTIEDDLARRDFTVNAIAEDESGALIDPFGGQIDLNKKLLRCVGNTEMRMREDALRMLRAIRFHITKGFIFGKELFIFLGNFGNAELLSSVSIERVREELVKCFDKDTLSTLSLLNYFPAIRDHIFSRNLKLTPTIKQV